MLVVRPLLLALTIDLYVLIFKCWAPTEFLQTISMWQSSPFLVVEVAVKRRTRSCTSCTLNSFGQVSLAFVCSWLPGLTRLARSGVPIFLSGGVLLRNLIIIWWRPRARLFIVVIRSACSWHHFVLLEWRESLGTASLLHEVPSDFGPCDHGRFILWPWQFLLSGSLLYNFLVQLLITEAPLGILLVLVYLRRPAEHFF